MCQVIIPITLDKHYIKFIQILLQPDRNKALVYARAFSFPQPVVITLRPHDPRILKFHTPDLDCGSAQNN